MDLIDRYKKWRLTRGDDCGSDTDSGGDSADDNTGGDSDTDWNMTIRMPSTTDSLGYSEPINSVTTGLSRVPNGDMTEGSPTKNRSSRSPSKETRPRSPEKQIISTGMSQAKSEQQIVSIISYKMKYI